MQPTKQQSPVSALHEILTWSASRPDWQRDALRRIIVNGSIEKDDLKELERLCRAKHNADASNDPAVLVEPLAATHLPPAPGAESSVSLVSIGDLNHVNRIPSDQVIPFGCAPGLTVIYGDNGSGKSGYVRVIKKACRARGTAPIILPNVFAPAVSAKAAAMIVFRTAGADIPVMWMNGLPTDPRLANIFVFDANSAGHYLQEDSAASFTPYGLDVLPLLSRTCDAIRDQLQQDINKIQIVIDGVAANWKYEAATAVGKLVANLSATTKQADLEALSGLDAQQRARLKDVSEALKSDPLQKAKMLRGELIRGDESVPDIPQPGKPPH